jgi:hypothetical protein
MKKKSEHFNLPIGDISIIFFKRGKDGLRKIFLIKFPLKKEIQKLLSSFKNQEKYLNAAFPKKSIVQKN